MTCLITETYIPSTRVMITALLAQLPPDSQTKDFRTICAALKDFKTRYPKLLPDVNFGHDSLSRIVEDIIFQMGVWHELYTSDRGYRTTKSLVMYFIRTIAPRLDPTILDIIRQEGPVFSAHIIAQ